MFTVIQNGLARYFYFAMSLLIVAVVVAGFGRTIDAGLLHPDAPRPALLYVHVTLCAAWVLLFALQSGLARTGRMALHRRLGVSAAVLGGALPIVGVATAIVMHNWRSARGPSNPAFLSVSLNDMLTFSIAFGLAIYWRRRPELHRRLMLIASCALTVAAFARLPAYLVPHRWWYAYVDLLILLGVARDLLVERRVHAVYRYGLPCVMAGQAGALYLYLAAPPAWLSLLHSVLRAAAPA